MKKYVLALFGIIFFANLSFGYGLLESSLYGTPTGAHSARSLGMGECSIAENNGIGGLFTNPATIALTKNIAFNANIEISRYGEEISRKVFDNFGNTIGDAAYASNTNYYITPTALGLVMPLNRFGLVHIVNLGFGFSRIYDFSYDYDETFFDNNYVKDFELKYQKEGDIKDYALGLSLRPHKAINIGASFHYLRGDWQVERDKIYFENPGMTSHFTSEFKDFSGMQFSYGAVFQPLNFAKRLMIGVYGKSAPSLKGDFSTDDVMTTRQITYPSEYGVGISYMPKNEISSRLSLDLTYTSWAELEDKIDGNLVELELDNTVGVHLGVEHILMGQMPVRAGFYYTRKYTNKDISAMNFTLGAGYFIKAIKIDVATELGKSNFYREDMAKFDEVFIPLELPNSVKFNETFMRFMATISYEL